MGVSYWIPPEVNGRSINKKTMIYRALWTFLGVAGRVIGRCERIRTSDPFLPKEVRYQAAPHTDIFEGRYYTRAPGGNQR